MSIETENRMGVMPVGKLLFKMSVPAICSMMMLSLYNIVDSVFVSKISEDALTAVSLAFPLQQLLISFAVGLSIGVCSVISRRLGEGNAEKANVAAQTGYTILFCAGIVFILIGIFATKAFIGLYASGTVIYSMAVQYLSINLIAGMGAFISTLEEKILQGTGDAVNPMIIQMSGCVFNIVFDPILIFGYFGFPAMGVVGAAVATVAGQFFAMFVGFFLIRRNHFIKINFFKFSYNRNTAKDIFQVGVPSVVMQGIGTVMTSLMNAILITYDIVATTVFGVFFKLQSFVFMPVFGLTQGLMPIVGYNFGTRNRTRMTETIKISLSVAFILMTCGMLVFTFFPDMLLGIFSASDQMLNIGCIALKRISLSFPLAAVSVIMGSVFQAIGKGTYSMATSIIRQIFLLIPASYILGKIGGLNILWFSFIFAEVFALGLSLVFFRKERTNWDF